MDEQQKRVENLFGWVTLVLALLFAAAVAHSLATPYPQKPSPGLKSKETSDVSTTQQ